MFTKSPSNFDDDDYEAGLPTPGRYHPFDEAIATGNGWKEAAKPQPFDMFHDFKDLSEETCGAVVGALTTKIVTLHGREHELAAVLRNFKMQYGDIEAALAQTIDSRALCEAALKSIMASGEFVKPQVPTVKERLTDGE